MALDQHQERLEDFVRQVNGVAVPAQQTSGGIQAERAELITASHALCPF